MASNTGYLISNVSYKKTDLNKLFIQYSSGTKNLDTGITVNGVDIANLFQKYSSGKKQPNCNYIANNTNYVTPTDFSQLFIPITYTIYNGDISLWNLSGGSTNSSTIGNPAPSISSSYHQYCYLDLSTIIPGLISLLGHTIQFDIYTNSLVDFFFACNSLGAGQYWRLETRNGIYSGMAQTFNWLTWNAPTSISGPTALAKTTWYTIIITIDTSGSATYTYNGVSWSNAYTILNNGTFIGVIGDGVGGGYIDNIIFT